MASPYAKYEDATLRKVLAVSLDGGAASGAPGGPPVVHLAELARVSRSAPTPPLYSGGAPAATAAAFGVPLAHQHCRVVPPHRS